MSKRFYCDDDLQHRNYGIFDLTKSDKTKEDFYDKKEEEYDIVHFEIYLVDETDSMLTGEEVCDTLNSLETENLELKEHILLLEKELLHYMDCAIWETSSNIDEDIEKECQRLFGKSKKEMYKKYPVCDTE